jgi:uncharacterized protein YwbE
MATYTVTFIETGKILATYTGLAPGKALELTHSNIHPAGCTVRIQEEHPQ